MIQLIDCLPFTDFEVLKKDWTRFQDGRVILSEIPDAICGEFECDAEIKENQFSEDTEGGKEDGISDGNGKDSAPTDNESDNKCDKKGDNDCDVDFILPTGVGKLILTARYEYSPPLL